MFLADGMLDCAVVVVADNPISLTGAAPAAAPAEGFTSLVDTAPAAHPSQPQASASR